MGQEFQEGRPMEMCRLEPTGQQGGSHEQREEWVRQRSQPVLKGGMEFGVWGGSRSIKEASVVAV